LHSVWIRREESAMKMAARARWFCSDNHVATKEPNVPHIWRLHRRKESLHAAASPLNTIAIL
jgi:hypothetical protein